MKIKELSQGVRDEAQKFYKDPEGLARHLRELEDKCQYIEAATPPDDAEEADEMLKALARRHSEVWDELDWLKKNATSNLRKEAKRLLQEIESGVLPACRKMKAFGFSCRELDEGERYWESARESFAKGDFETAVQTLKDVREKLESASKTLAAARLNQLIAQARELKKSGDWEACAKAADEALKSDPMNLEMEMLRDEAIEHWAGRRK